MKPHSLLHSGRYSIDWIRDFYTQGTRWWGEDPHGKGTHTGRAETVARLCGAEPRRILELGCGAGYTAAALADSGHDVTAIDLSPLRAGLAQELASVPRKGRLTVRQADFYTEQFEHKFGVVCQWEGFGLGSDADQRRLLKRVATDWLAPGGSLLMDVYSPVRFARHAGEEERLAPLPGVPESVEMYERTHFDPVHCRWIDEWVPAAAPEQALAQAIRCYTPADLLLLVDGTRLRVKRIEVEGEQLDWTDQIAISGTLLEAESYLAQLELERG